MSRRVALLSLFLAVLGTLGCGKKGPIMAPLVRVPQPVTDVRLSRVGDRVLLGWTTPTAYADGNPLKGWPEVEIWVIEEAKPEAGPPPKPGKGDFEKSGRLMMKVPGERPASLLEKDLPVRRTSVVLEPDPAVLAQKHMFFSLRARDEKKRSSEFSDPVALEPGRRLPSPGGIQASVFEDRIELAWTSSGEPQDPSLPKIAGYNIYRSEGQAPPVRLNAAPIPGSEFRDEGFSFGKAYVYFVRSAAEGAPGAFESDDSESVKVEPMDRFAPAAPQGLTTVSGNGFIALSWEPSKESDLAGYRVWRREAGQAKAVLLRELSPAENSFSDTAVENAKRYVYAITAFDRAGNESGKSAEAADLARRSKG